MGPDREQQIRGYPDSYTPSMEDVHDLLYLIDKERRRNERFQKALESVVIQGDSRDWDGHTDTARKALAEDGIEVRGVC